MNTIVKKETEGTVLNMLVDASYVPCFEKLRKTGFEIPDLRFMFVYLPDGKVKDLAEFYVGFENYAPIHFIGGVCDPHEEEDFIEIIKCAALRNVLEYDYLQKELLSDLDESELIFEELKWDEEDFEEELCCEKILETNETIDTESCNTLYATLPTAEFPVFALLQSAGFELSNLLCQVKFAPHSDKKIGTCIRLSYKFDGYGDYALIRTIPLSCLDEELTPALLTDLAFSSVQDIPAFYFHLIKNLPHSKCIMKYLENASKLLKNII